MTVYQGKQPWKENNIVHKQCGFFIGTNLVPPSPDIIFHNFWKVTNNLKVVAVFFLWNIGNYKPFKSGNSLDIWQFQNLGIISTAYCHNVWHGEGGCNYTLLESLILARACFVNSALMWVQMKKIKILSISLHLPSSNVIRWVYRIIKS